MAETLKGCVSRVPLGGCAYALSVPPPKRRLRCHTKLLMIRLRSRQSATIAGLWHRHANRWTYYCSK